MQEVKVEGSCLCGNIKYEITGNLGIFQYCHCSRCRKFTGSAHAANLLVLPNQFKWLKGEKEVTRFLPNETKHFATAFCNNCGSSMPWNAKSGKSVVIPAGSLDEHPGIEPFQNIFFESRAKWYKAASDLPEYNKLPKK
ncbi:GFA family protein [Spongorhabdus nitratireducens]